MFRKRRAVGRPCTYVLYHPMDSCVIKLQMQVFKRRRNCTLRTKINIGQKEVTVLPNIILSLCAPNWQGAREYHCMPTRSDRPTKLNIIIENYVSAKEHHSRWIFPRKAALKLQGVLNSIVSAAKDAIDADTACGDYAWASVNKHSIPCKFQHSMGGLCMTSNRQTLLCLLQCKIQRRTLLGLNVCGMRRQADLLIAAQPHS